MRPRACTARALAVAVAALALAVVGLVGPASAERKQRGNVIVALHGEISPLNLPRDRLAPVSVRFKGGLRTDDGSLLPRVTKVAIGLPSQGVIATRGLPVCSSGQLRHAKPPSALAACRAALVGRGKLEAKVRLPDQEPFSVRAPLLLFNGLMPGGGRAVLLHAYARRPPIVAVLPFAFRRGSGAFGTVLEAHLPPALGPWPRFASFEMTLFRRYRYRGRWRSFLSASCPIPPALTAGFFSLARSAYTFEDGRRIEVEIARSCRGR